jgi:hypothetical protein
MLSRFLAFLFLSLLVCFTGRTNAGSIGVNVNDFLYGAGIKRADKGGTNVPTSMTAVIGKVPESGIHVLRVPIDFDAFLKTSTEINWVLQQLQSLASRTESVKAEIYVAPVMQARRSYVAHTARLADDQFRAQFRKVLGHLGAGLVAISPDRFFLEILNEPEYCGQERQTWSKLQDELYRELRAQLPRLKIVLSAECWGNLEMLLGFDLRPYAADQLAHFTFHYYAPRLFTLQNYPWSTTHLKYVDAISLFRECNASNDVRKKMIDKIAGTPGLGVGEKERLIGRFERALREFNQGEDWDVAIGGQFHALRDKALRAGMSPRRIHLGEFGVFKSPVSDAHIREDRLFWVQTVKEQAEANGFSWTYWAAVGPFGVWDNWNSMIADARLLDVLAGRVRITRRQCH